MKTLPFFAALILSGGAVQAVEISYSGTSSVSDRFSPNQVNLPLFDPAQGFLQAVRIEVESSVSAGILILHNLGNQPAAFSGTTRFEWQFLIGSPLPLWTSTVPFEAVSSQIPSMSGMATTVVSSSTSFVFTDNNLAAYTTGGPPLSIVAQSVVGSSIQHPNLLGVSTDRSFASMSARVTYFYSVPDGGSTLALLSVGLLTLRSAASRR